MRQHICERMASRRNSIPADVFVPVLQEIVDPLRTHYEKTEQGNNSVMSPMNALAFQSGITIRTLSRYFSGQNKYIDFDNADRILCALGIAYLWYQKPLSDYYWNVSLCDKLTEIQKKKRRKRGTRICASLLCSNVFTLKSQPHQTYCSSKCRQEEKRRRRYARLTRAA